MIPVDLCNQFSIKSTYATKKGEYLLISGNPCKVTSLNWNCDTGLEIQSIGLFDKIMYSIQFKQIVPLLRFTPEYKQETVLFSENGETFTNMDNIFISNASAGDTLIVKYAPVYILGKWEVGYKMEKIIQGQYLDPDIAVLM